MRRIGVVGKGQDADLEATLVRLAEWARAHEIERSRIVCPSAMHRVSSNQTRGGKRYISVQASATT